MSLHPSGGAEHKTTSFKGTSLPVVFTLSAFFFFLFHGLGTTDPHTCHSSHKKRSLLVNRSTTKIIQMRQNIEHNPHKYLSNTPGGVQGSASG